MNTPQIKNGGPAYPCEVPQRASDGTPMPVKLATGMTLRDWFAGMALQGNATRDYRDILASDCYKIADAMIAAREAAK